MCMEVRSAKENAMQDSLAYRGRSQTYKQASGHPCKGKPYSESRTYTMHVHTVLTCSNSRIISSHRIMKRKTILSFTQNFCQKHSTF